jgi:hypothetical protein
MSNRSLVSLVVILIAVILIVKLDVITKVKVNVTNLIYGEEMRGIKALRVVVDPLTPELEKEGLTREAILLEIEPLLEKNGVRVLNEEDWLKTPEHPSLNVTISATKKENGLYQFDATISIQKSEEQKPGAVAEKLKLIWVTSGGMAEGGVSDIHARIVQETGLFLKSREN